MFKDMAGREKETERWSKGCDSHRESYSLPLVMMHCWAYEEATLGSNLQNKPRGNG